MKNVNQEEALFSVQKNENDGVEVIIRGQLEDLICMLSAAMLSSESTKAVIKSAVELTDTYILMKDNNIPQC